MFAALLTLALTYEPHYFQVCAHQLLFKQGEEWHNGCGSYAMPIVNFGREVVVEYEKLTPCLWPKCAQKTPPATEVTDGAELSHEADSTPFPALGSTERNGVRR